MKKQILVVDDNENTRNGYKGLLESEDISVIVAKDGEEGYKLAKENKLDLIITDYDMPKVNGLEMAAKIKLEANIPIVMVTGTKLENPRYIDYYISKPFDIDKFLNLVLKELEK